MALGVLTPYKGGFPNILSLVTPFLSFSFFFICASSEKATSSDDLEENSELASILRFSRNLFLVLLVSLSSKLEVSSPVALERATPLVAGTEELVSKA